MLDNESVAKLFTWRTISTWYIAGPQKPCDSIVTKRETSTGSGRWEKRRETKDIKHKGRNEKYRIRCEMNLFSSHFWEFFFFLRFYADVVLLLKWGHFMSHYIMIQSCQSSGKVGGFCVTITAALCQWERESVGSWYSRRKIHQKVDT